MTDPLLHARQSWALYWRLAVRQARRIAELEREIEALKAERNAHELRDLDDCARDGGVVVDAGRGSR